MRTFVILTVSIHILGLLFLLNRLAKQKYPITTESTSGTDVTRVVFALIWIISGMYVLLQR